MQNVEKKSDGKCCANCEWWHGHKRNTGICTRFDECREGDLHFESEVASLSANDPDVSGVFITGRNFGCTCFLKAKGIVEPYDFFDL